MIRCVYHAEARVTITRASTTAPNHHTVMLHLAHGERADRRAQHDMAQRNGQVMIVASVIQITSSYSSSWEVHARQPLRHRGGDRAEARKGKAKEQSADQCDDNELRPNHCEAGAAIKDR